MKAGRKQKKDISRHLRRWECGLLLAFGLTLLTGTFLSGQQRALAGAVIRLHVIGSSDSAEDQAVKLQVRDAALSRAEELLAGVEDAQEAKAILTEHLDELARVGSEIASAPVRAEVEENTWFPTKHYLDFSLPAGRYTALKLTVGEGQGRNWWCVVFPPLCMGAVSDREETTGSLSQEQIRLLTGENEGYVVKFKAMELWNRWTGAEA